MVMFRKILIACACVCVCACGIIFTANISYAQQQQQTSGTIILLIDMSYSIDDDEAEFQMKNYYDVLNQLPVLRNYTFEVITYGEDSYYQVQNGSWEETINFFDTWDRMEDGGGTCLNNPIQTVISNYDNYTKPVVIDITGDGPHNCTAVNGGVNLDTVHLMLDKLENKGVQINTLFIGNQEDNEDTTSKTREEHYEEFSSMVRGNGFSLKANNYMEFEFALFEKLVMEIVYLMNQK